MSNITPEEFKRIDLDDVVFIWAYPNKSGGYDLPIGIMPRSAITAGASVVGPITVLGVTRMGMETIKFEFEYNNLPFSLGNGYGYEYVYSVNPDKKVTVSHVEFATRSPYCGPPLSCINCKTVNEYAEPNLPNNQLVCYSCRIWSPKLQSEFDQFNANRS